MKNQVPPVIRGNTRHPDSVRTIQRSHGSAPERQPRARRGPGTPDTRYAGRPRTLPREMRPRAPRSSAPLRLAMRARDEHSHHAVGNTVQTSSELPLRISRRPVRANGAYAQRRP